MVMLIFLVWRRGEEEDEGKGKGNSAKRKKSEAESLVWRKREVEK